MYSTYADDTFFVSGENSVIKVMNAFYRFLILSGLKPNQEKCELALVPWKGYHWQSALLIVLT